MILKHSIVSAIIAVLTAALFFCVGMQYAIKHIEIDPDPYTQTALVYLNGQAYIYDIDN